MTFEPVTNGPVAPNAVANALIAAFAQNGVSKDGVYHVPVDDSAQELAEDIIVSLSNDGAAPTTENIVNTIRDFDYAAAIRSEVVGSVMRSFEDSFNAQEGADQPGAEVQRDEEIDNIGDNADEIKIEFFDVVTAIQPTVESKVSDTYLDKAGFGSETKEFIKENNIPANNLIQ